MLAGSGFSGILFQRCVAGIIVVFAALGLWAQCEPIEPQSGPPAVQPPPAVLGVDFTAHCIRTRCTFIAASFQQPIEADIRSYSWDFGDGPILGAGGFNVHEYVFSEPSRNFLVTLNVTFDSGASTTASHIVTAKLAETHADFFYRPELVGPGPAPIDADGNPLGLYMYFDSYYNNPNPDTQYFYSWFFGDGSPECIDPVQCGRRPHHYYAQPGNYVVRLTVEERVRLHPEVLVGTDTKELQIVAKNRPPRPDFTAPCTVQGCTFDAAPSLDDGQGASGVTSWSWDYGDGNFATGAQTSHAYTLGARPYTVTLTVKDGFGAAASDSKTVTPPDRPPIAAFHFGCSGLACKFDASPTTDDNGIASYSWNFGNGTSIGQSTSNGYPADGRYNVTLTVVDTAGNSVSAKRSVSVSSAPVSAQEKFRPITPCRAFDSRFGDAPALASGVKRAISLVTGPCALPVAATSVAVTATVIPSPASGVGFLQLGQAGIVSLETSTLNFSSDRVPRGNNAIVQLNNGSIDAMVFANQGGPVDLILDVTGFFTPDQALLAKGLAFVPLSPCQLFDSRVTPPGVAAGIPRTVRIGGAGHCGIPVTAEAAALNLAVTSSSGAGNLRMYAADIAVPPTSALNYQPWTIPQANGALTALSLDATRAVSLQLDVATVADVVLDTTGYFQTDGPSTLTYHPIRPCRAVNTLDPNGGEARLQGGVRRGLQIRGNCGVPAEARAAVVNLTVVSPDGAGSLVAYPGDQDDPPALSMVSFTAGEHAIGNGGILPLSQDPRDLAVYPFLPESQGLDLVVDVVGYFSSPVSVGR
jgi:PKD repeat protein